MKNDVNKQSYRNSVKEIAFLGLFLALAVILGYVESFIPVPFGIPGIKLGLANIATVFMLYTMGRQRALLILILRILIVGLLFGNMFGILYSLAGGLISYIVMALLVGCERLSVCGVSILGGVSHNIGQLIVAMFVVENLNLIYYLPVLVLSGAICGLAIGIGGGIVIKRLSSIS